MTYPFTKDYIHDAKHLLVKRVRSFQADGRHWLASAYMEAFEKCLERDDGEMIATAMNYVHGFEQFCVDYLGMTKEQFMSKAEKASNGA